MKNLYTIVLLLIVSTCVSAKVYKWVDANGQTHYSDKKPEDTRTTEVSIKKTPKSSIKQQQYEPDDNTETQKKLDDYAEHDKELRETKKYKKQECKEAKESLNEFKEQWTGNRKYSDSGGYIYRTEADKNRRKEHYQKHIGNYQKKVKDRCR